ncbi:MAG: purine-nucleoside phosphorylase [Firmicutes bacterium]|nr:purine-nucleoside phosphorylase [Bacillota bacterium]MBQ6842844.1 purine-nucleoside phosphorylase [Bacillota bacterium]MBR7113125.1 purine-nucleoside phosphorylase [Bacillota bacterium]
MTNAVYAKVQNCYQQVRNMTDFVPQVAVVLGSGLGAFADEIDIVTTISYHDIDGFPVSTVSGHAGRFVFGYVDGVPVVLMQGRVHYYEGYPMTDVVLPIRLMLMLGAKKLLLTNAAGGVNTGFQAGDFMMITDHISTFIPSPLISANIDELGPRFPDMSEVYTKSLREAVRRAASSCGVQLQQGVYLQLTGPCYETPTEIRMCRMLGADAVGMSTVCEAIAARHAGAKVAAISCITNMAAGVTAAPLSHEEVKETADRVSVQFKALLRAAIKEIGAVED